MPVQYGSIVEEHHAVRRRAGLFDIGHMGRLAFAGPDVVPWLERATTNRVGALQPGRIQYSLICNDQGGVVDDILVYLSPSGIYSVVCNAGNRARVVSTLRALHAGRAEMFDLTEETAMIAVQGPAAAGCLRAVGLGAAEALGYYRCTDLAGLDGLDPDLAVTVSRTGYTGEDGFELVVPASVALTAWERLMAAVAAAGGLPCGLGARDTLRFEAAMPLYGHELDDTIDPYEAGLGWAVKLDKGDFVGRAALRARKAQPERVRVGLALGGKRIARQGAEVLDPEGRPPGVVTSGTFAPTLERSLAMALVRPDLSAPGTALQVDVRGHLEPSTVVPLPFYTRARTTAGGSTP
jgi:aminomethyltransferase